VDVKLIVSDRESVAQGLRVRSSYVLISIRDPGVQPVRMPRPTALRAVLHLIFNDAEPVTGFNLPAGVRLMIPAQARRILRFVDEHRDHVGAVVVQCHQGMSRSPAVAAAIARYMQLDDQKFWQEYSPNQYVYALMLNEFKESKKPPST